MITRQPAGALRPGGRGGQLLALAADQATAEAETINNRRTG
jgi:hypothetical protein